MAKALRVGQVAEWFKATVLKTGLVYSVKPHKSRISNSFRPRMKRTTRPLRRFAMAQMSAQIKPLATRQGNEGQSNNRKEAATDMNMYSNERCEIKSAKCSAKSLHGHESVTKTDNAAILRELARVKCEFQMRAICAAMGVV